MKIGSKVTNPGEFKTQIILESPTTSQDAGGFTTMTYTTIATVWSRWKNAHGSALLQAQIEGVEAPATVLIRYRSDIDETCVVKKSGVRYEIKGSLDDIDERHEYIELKVLRIKAG